MRADEQKPDTRRQRRTSGQWTAKSISIKGAKRKSGGGAWTAVELTSGDLQPVPDSGLRGLRGSLTALQKSAEGIVTRAVGEAREALQSRKAEQRLGRTGNGGRRPERSPQGVDWRGQ